MDSNLFYKYMYEQLQSNPSHKDTLREGDSVKDKFLWPFMAACI